MLNKGEAERVLNLAREVDVFNSEYEGDLTTARHNAAVRGLTDSMLRGMAPSPEFMKDIQAWVRGELTTEQVTQKVFERDQAEEVQGGQDTV